MNPQQVWLPTDSETSLLRAAHAGTPDDTSRLEDYIREAIGGTRQRFDIFAGEPQPHHLDTSLRDSRESKESDLDKTSDLDKKSDIEQEK